MITSYDYDAPMDEYGMPAEPKYSHLKALHEVLFKFESEIVSNFPHYVRLGAMTEAHLFGDYQNGNGLAMISNSLTQDVRVKLFNHAFNLDRWSVMFVQGPASRPTILFNTAHVTAAKTQQVFEPIAFAQLVSHSYFHN